MSQWHAHSPLNAIKLLPVTLTLYVKIYSVLNVLVLKYSYSKVVGPFSQLYFIIDTMLYIIKYNTIMYGTEQSCILIVYYT